MSIENTRHQLRLLVPKPRHMCSFHHINERMVHMTDRELEERLRHILREFAGSDSPYAQPLVYYKQRNAARARGASMSTSGRPSARTYLKEPIGCYIGPNTNLFGREEPREDGQESQSRPPSVSYTASRLRNMSVFTEVGLPLNEKRAVSGGVFFFFWGMMQDNTSCSKSRSKSCNKSRREDVTTRGDWLQTKASSKRQPSALSTLSYLNTNNITPLFFMQFYFGGPIRTKLAMRLEMVIRHC